MLKSPRLSLVERVAAGVLRERNIEKLSVDPFAIAHSCDITVEAKRSGQPGCSGMLLRIGDTFGIIYSADILSPGFQRFSVAHELGHYFLPDHPENVLSNGMHVSRAGFGSADPYEREADHFASSILMPKTLFRAAIASFAEGLDAVIGAAQICETSLTATAIQYSRLTDAAIAVVLSQNGIASACFLSDAMKSAHVGWLRKGEPVPRNSETFARSVASAGGSKSSNGESDLADWFGCRSVSAIEGVVSNGPGSLLTVLYSEELSIEMDDVLSQDDEEEERLIKSWTPQLKY
jgi:Zn-dependent peptidase ImmA (M78 family)